MTMKKVLAMGAALVSAGLTTSITCHDLGETIFIDTHDLYEFTTAFDIMSQFYKWKDIVYVPGAISYQYATATGFDNVIIRQLWE